MLVLMGSGLIVNITFSHRSDWASHVVAGGAAAMVWRACTPLGVRRWAGASAAVMVLVASIVAEVTLVGPWDGSDVAFTTAGALLVAGERLPHDRSRPSSIVTGSLLFAGAVGFRYGIRRGP